MKPREKYSNRNVNKHSKQENTKPDKKTWMEHEKVKNEEEIAIHLNEPQIDY